jgi:hypothetical protein
MIRNFIKSVIASTFAEQISEVVQENETPSLTGLAGTIMGIVGLVKHEESNKRMRMMGTEIEELKAALEVTNKEMHSLNKMVLKEVSETERDVHRALGGVAELQEKVAASPTLKWEVATMAVKEAEEDLVTLRWKQANALNNVQTMDAGK